MWSIHVSLSGGEMINRIQKFIDQRIRDIKVNSLKYKSFSEYLNSYEILFSYADYMDLKERKFLYDVPDENLTCIFCLKKEPHTVFDDKSHVIPHSIGNHFLMHREECKNCNKKFGDTIETELANFSKKYLVINGQKNRNKKNPGYLKYQAKSQKAFLQMKNIDNQKVLEVTGEQSEDILKEHGTGKISLTFEANYRDSEVYKAFMKSIYGVIPPEYRKDFSVLRNWINTEDHNIKLINNLMMYQTILPTLHTNNLIMNVFRKKNTIKNMFLRKDNYDYFALIGFGNVIFDIPILSDATLRKIQNKTAKNFILPILSDLTVSKIGALRSVLEMSNTEKRPETVKFELQGEPRQQIKCHQS